MLGVPAESLIGKTMDEVFPSDLAKNMIADDLRILKEGKNIEAEEELNGRLYYSQKFPIFLKGKPSYLAGYTIDITEQRQSELLIQRQNQELKELNAAKDRLFSLIAHDLRSPFNSILGYSELLLENAKGRFDDETAVFTEIIKLSANSTLNLLDNLLDWAKSQTGQMNFNPDKIILNDIIQEIIEFFYPTAKIKNISINLLQSDNIEVYADANMLRTIIRNLIHNAIKFTNLNGEIVIYANILNNNVQVTVSDNGVGMDQATLDKLFKPDSNIVTLGTAKEKGSGLGLLICKEFIDKHHGKIWVFSEVGKGSDFKFSIPASIT
jgi:signal transduction histidine kinase